MWLPPVVPIIGKWLQQSLGQPLPMVEACIVGCIESIEDRSPLDEDVYLFLARKFSADRRAVIFTWKQKEIVRIEQDKDGGWSKIFSMVNPFENIPD